MRSLICAAALAAVSGLASAQSIIDLNALPGGVISPFGAPPGVYEYATATTISEDGLQVGGTSNGVAVRYSLDGNRPIQLPAAGGGSGGAVTGITNDGFLVGWNLTAGPFRAQTWDASNNRLDLGPIGPGGGNSYLTGVSGDGSIAVGYGLLGGQFLAATYRSDTGWSTIGSRPGFGGFQLATNISRDGSTVVGFDGLGAFRWRQGSGFSTLQNLSGAQQTIINDASANGDISVGSTSLSDGFSYATIWNGNQAENVGRLAGYRQTILNAVSSDGTAAVGYAFTFIDGIPANDARNSRAVYWSVETGLVDLNLLMADFGLSLPDDGILTFGADISGDGNVIVGNYQNSIGEIRAFYFTIPSPSGAALLVAAGVMAARRRRA